ncbi:MAG TPA: hypothetical protein VGB67_15845, partial [Fibrella sp.]
MLVAVATGLGVHASAQVKIGNNPTVIDPDAVLELEHPNKALLITRVALTNTSDVTTIPSPTAGMVVYNTNSGITAVNASYQPGGAGVYYWDGTGWVYSGVGSLINQFWSLNGNANAVDGVNFLGTTNNTPLNFRINNLPSGRIDLNGNTTLGYRAGQASTNGLLNNTYIGSLAGSAGTIGTAIGSANTAVGASALANVTNGNNNTAVGQGAGDAFANYNNNTFIGQDADATAASVVGSTALGQGARVSQSNSVILGNTGVNVGIGNTAPSNRLHVTGTDPLRLEGLQALASADSVLTTDANGVVKKVSRASVLSPIQANNGLTRVNDSIQLGGTLTRPVTTIGASAANLIAITGLQNGGSADSVLTIGAGGVVRRNSLSNLGGTVRAGNGLTKTGDSISLGGTLTAPTNITTAGNNVSLTGTGNLAVADSITAGNAVIAGGVRADSLRILNAAAINGPATVGSTLGVVGVATAGGFTTTGNTTTGTLTATNLTPGAITDSVLTINTATGVVRRVSVNTLGAVTTASNGLTKVGNDIQLGGTLSAPTAIATAGNNLSLTG